MAGKIKVFHVEDYKIMRDGISILLGQHEEIDLVGGSQDGEGLLSILKTREIDIVILDIYLDSMGEFDTKNGFEICQLVKQQFPHVEVIIHSTYEDADRIAKSLQAGAKGYVSKKSGFDQLLEAIKVVHAGKVFTCTHICSKLKNLNNFLKGLEKLKGKEEIFSERERQVLVELAMGKSSKQIADDLFITERTVESHRKNMIEKADVKNAVELIAYASSIGLLKI
jgi:DNA-binding NarL/FixJ family response regulator